MGVESFTGQSHLLRTYHFKAYACTGLKSSSEVFGAKCQYRSKMNVSDILLKKYLNPSSNLKSDC